MPIFNKQKEIIKKDIKEEINNLVNDGKVISIGILAVGCLTVGYILGCVTTGAMCRTLVSIR